MSKIRCYCLATLLLFLLSGCVSSESPTTGQEKRTPAGSGPSPQPTLVVSTPAPGPVPQHCPTSNPIRHSISHSIGPLIGASPVWATWPPGPNIFHLTPPPNSPYPSSYQSPYGWGVSKVVWEVGPDYHNAITMRGYEMSDHTPFWFQFLDQTPITNAVLDPQHPDHPVSAMGAHWAEWGSDLIVPKAGCYILQVSWPTGQWNLTFAVGA